MKNQIHKRKCRSIISLSLKKDIYGRNASRFEHISFHFGNLIPQIRCMKYKVWGMNYDVRCKISDVRGREMSYLFLNDYGKF